MAKIKDIIERLHKNPSEYTLLRFLVAKRIVALFMMLYFVSVLFTIGGMSFGWFSTVFFASLRFHLFTVLAVAMGWFLYESGYAVNQQFSTPKPMFPIIWGVVAGCLTVFILVGHLKSIF